MAQPIFMVEESNTARAARIAAGAKYLVDVDAAAFQRRFEADRREALAWSEWKLQRLAAAKAVEAFPIVGATKEFGLGVEDGRHRIAEAARRGATITVAVSGKREAARLTKMLAA